MEMCSKLL